MMPDTGLQEGDGGRKNFALQDAKLLGLPPAKPSKCAGEKEN